MWLSTFKLLAFCADRGPMARPGLTALQQTLLFLLPIHPRSPQWGAPPSLVWVLTVLLGKVLLQAAVVLVVTYVPLHPFLLHSFWAVCIWNLVAMAVDVAVPFVQYLMGMPLNPSMNKPYLSVSIQEFWSQRYNLVTTTCLRQTVYEPIMDCSVMRPPRPGATLEREDDAAAAPAAPNERARQGAPLEGGGGGGGGGPLSDAGSCQLADCARNADAPGAGGDARSVSGASSCAAGSDSSTAGSSSGGSEGGGRAGGGGSGSDTDPEADADWPDGPSHPGLRRRRAGAAFAAAVPGGAAPDALCDIGAAAAPKNHQRAAAAGAEAAAARAAGVAVKLAARAGKDQGVPLAPASGEPSTEAAAAGSKVAAGRKAGAAGPVPEWRKSLATLMVFVASGVMHELIIWYTCHSPAYSDGAQYVFGPILLFFTLQAPALQAEKWTLQLFAGLRRPLPQTPPSRTAAAGAALLRAAWGAARVVMVYAWLWGLADVTFWRSTQACRLERRLIPEILAALDAARGAAARAAEGARGLAAA